MVSVMRGREPLANTLCVFDALLATQRAPILSTNVSFETAFQEWLGSSVG